MAEQHHTEGASTSGDIVSDSSTVELNIKTLDSQIYIFNIDKNMRVSLFKEKIADQIGVPVAQQRLIFRGKVLKDDHLLSEYHVENGDTLHLVERQPTQPQTSSGRGSVDTFGNNGTQGNDIGAAGPRNRVGQISHSVVLGSINLGDQGEGVGSDLTQVIGAVLNSFGIGGRSSNTSGPQGSDAEQGRSSAGDQSNRAQFGQTFLNQPSHAPFAGASIPLPSLNTPLLDSLNTISEFITRMEEVLSQNGYQTTQSAGLAAQPATGLPSNTRGLPTPEALSTVLRHAQRLLSGHAAAALSHIAGRLDQDAGSTDDSVRSQIQTESAQVGLAMQHLGALLLELGRTILTMRMGRSPGEAVINAGPAVYISSSGPNPIMVQPFPLQTSSLFNAATVSVPSTGNSGPMGIIGSAPRNINIHIHAGTPLAPVISAVGARAATGDVTQGERTDPTTDDSGSTLVSPVRNVIPTAVPTRATFAFAPASNASQSVGGVSTSQSSHAALISSGVTEINSTIRDIVENRHTENRTPGQQENQPVPSSSGSDGGGGEVELKAQENRTESQERDPCPLDGEFVEKSASNLKEAKKSDVVDHKSIGARDVPIGLGGGLQPKRRNRSFMTELKSGEDGTSSSSDQRQQARSSGQQVLQSLATLTASARNGSNDLSSRQSGQVSRLGGAGSGMQGSDRQLDVTGMMSQMFQSPALNGLLSGVAQQTGVGSPDVLRNMFQQFTQSPAMRNTVNTLVQQVDREDVRDMFAEAGSGQDSGLDFSRMIQQMMPVVSQVLGGGSIRSEQARNMVPEDTAVCNDDVSLSKRDSVFSESSQNDLQEAVQRIALRSSSRDIFGAVVQNTAAGELLEGLSNDEDLANEFVAMLTRDLRDRLEGGSASDGGS